jgi:O-acetyl-ADP-ribose deacetylase (regulator of RNase III)
MNSKLQLNDLKITFVSLNNEINHVIRKVFPIEQYPNIKSVCQNVSKCVPHDCIVSPANSFGQMDGGIDKTLSYLLMKNQEFEYIGEKVRNIISYRYSGEQPVGTCILLNSGSPFFPFLAHAPTMTVPTDVVDTLNAYYAFKSVLEEIVNHNRDCENSTYISSLLTTTFCTGYGEMSITNSLIQMKKAYDIVNSPIIPTWENANELVSELKIIKKMGYTAFANNILLKSFTKQINKKTDKHIKF